MKKSAKIFVAGGQSGLVGTAIVRNLRKKGYKNILVKQRSELNLLDCLQVAAFFQKEKPDYVFLAAAKVGGIMSNKTQKAEFIYDNLQIQNNVIYNAWKNDVKKLEFLGSSCIYPKFSPQPIREEYFLTGKLEETNDAYAIAKIAGTMMCQSFYQQYGCNFISVMPTNLYGPHDNFDLQHSHVLPAMIRKFHEAKIDKKDEVTLWGTGNVFREFLYVDDMADACVYLMEHYDSPEIINIGKGKDLTIKELADIVKNVIKFEGEIRWDTSKPDGTPRKQLDVTKLFDTGWRPRTTLRTGIKKEYEWFLQHYESIKK